MFRWVEIPVFFCVVIRYTSFSEDTIGSEFSSKVQITSTTLIICASKKNFLE